MKQRTVTAEDETIRRLVLEIAKALVDHSEAVKVDLIVGDVAITLCLLVAPPDVGKVIGKQGRTARSIRTIVHGAGMKLNKRYALDIWEEPKNVVGGYMPSPNP